MKTMTFQASLAAAVMLAAAWLASPVSAQTADPAGAGRNRRLSRPLRRPALRHPRLPRRAPSRLDGDSRTGSSDGAPAATASTTASLMR